ncbi:MAG: WD40 repeat domain-containing protein [Candidatus Thermoplasmatota archaeon]|nr:WD40 repeat domain-containing protein [Candidatus Thermoplasmatota archaeon]
MLVKMRSKVTIMMLIICLAPTASASSSGMNFIDTTLSSATDAYTNSITVNSNNTIIASSYDTFVELHNSSTLQLINRFDLGREVFDIDFSPNGRYIAATTLAIESIQDSVKVIDILDMEIKPQQARGNNRAGNIDWSHDGSMLIVPNMNNGALVLNSTHLGEVMALNGAHTSDVTCVGFSRNSELMITGDELGKVQLWDNSGESLSFTLDVEEEVTGCDFSFMDAKIALSTTSGNVYSYSVNGLLLQSKDSGVNYGIKWSETEDILYVLESDSTPELVALDGSTFSHIHSTRLLHKSIDFHIIEHDSILTKFFVATDTNHIALYGSPTYPEGYGVMGSDLDGDNIPDTIDLDDDGDSFQDDWDFNCLNASLCSRDPDTSTIRSMIISIDSDTLIVEDIYTMSQTDTYTFRNLSRRSIISDLRISYEETNMIESAFCHNMDANDYIQKLQSSIELSFGQVTNGTLKCQITGGLSFSKTFDKEQLRFSFKTTFEVSPNITLPMLIYLNEQISVEDSSITHMVENHPILLQQITLTGESLSTLWWNSDDSVIPELNYTAIPVQESQIKSVMDLIVENLLLITIISISIILMLWALVRRRNLNLLIMDDADFAEDEENTEIDEDSYVDKIDEEYSKPIPIINEDYLAVQIDDDPIITETLPSEEKPTDRRAFTIDDDAEFVERRDTKRRKGRTQRNAQGPIMTTKRKRLDGKLDIPGEQIIAGKKSVRKVSKKVPTAKKVRRVRSVKKDD